MSSAMGAVIFPDGDVRFTVYHGTVDIMYRSLIEEKRWLDGDEWADDFGLPEDEGAEVFDAWACTDYGAGSWWRCKATKRRLLVGLDPTGNNAEGEDDIPEGGLHHRFDEPYPEWYPFDRTYGNEKYSDAQ